jgi:flagellar basal-body rod modification protein FlgD
MALTTGVAAAAPPPTAAGASGQTARPGGTLASNFDGFLKLLSAQLEHQDPLSPLDATQFTSQLVQFSTVEQAIRTNDQLGKLTRLIEGDGLTSALGFIGLEVEFSADRVRLGAEGGAAVDYQLPAAAAEVKVTVLDQRGRIVHERTGAPAGAGHHRYVWDGRGDDGARAPEGVYRVEVRAADAEGAPVEVARRSRGRVDGVETGASGLQLAVGGVPVPLAGVKAVHRPPAAAAASAAQQ